MLYYLFSCQVPYSIFVLFILKTLLRPRDSSSPLLHNVDISHALLSASGVFFYHKFLWMQLCSVRGCCAVREWEWTARMCVFVWKREREREFAFSPSCTSKLPAFHTTLWYNMYANVSVIAYLSIFLYKYLSMIIFVMYCMSRK